MTRTSAIAALAASVAAVGLIVYFASPAMPDLDEAVRLAEDGYFDDSEAMLGRAVEVAPAQARPRMLLAQVLINRFDHGRDRSDLAPIRRALDQLNAIKPDSPALEALILLWKGKAERRLMQLGPARVDWAAALKADPAVPEATWALLDLDYLGGRSDQARALAMAQVAVEPDPAERARLLLELLRQDAMPVAAGALVQIFEPMLKEQPNDPEVRRGLGLALVRDGQDVRRGLDLLNAELAAHPDDPDAWDAFFNAVELGNRADLLVEALLNLPASMAADPRFARYQGRAAQEAGDWQAALDAYRVALTRLPHEPTLEYRLVRCLRRLGPAHAAEAAAIEACHAGHEAAQPESYPLFVEAGDAPGLGTVPHPDLIARIADQRDRRGRHAEAAAWRTLARGTRPDPSDGRAPPRELR